ncbi:HAD hydrolase-like protein [Arthrobacter tecti]
MTNTRFLILFDLDGTLVDPEGAITGGIADALRNSGLPVPSPDQLRQMVGPALVRSLIDIAGIPERRVDEVVAKYREKYRTTGMALSRPYPGIVSAIGQLNERGHLLAVATQKPEWLALELLGVQQMAGLFASVHGSPAVEREAAKLDGKRTIIAAALAAHAGNYSHAIMVGDRSHDVDGAAANGLDCVAVSWGFGTTEEFAAANAAVVVDSAEALVRYLDDRVRQVSGTVVHGRL